MGEVFDDLPPWFIPVVLVLIVVAAMFTGKKGSAQGNGQGSMINYTPIPLDPGAVEIANTETNAKSSAFSSLLQFQAAKTISQLNVDRDVTLETLHADSANRKTQAALDADLAHTQAVYGVAIAQDTTQRVTSLAETAKDQMLGLAVNDTNRNVSLSQIASNLAAVQTVQATDLAKTRTNANRDTDIATTNANRDTSLASINSKTAITTNAQTTNTQKAESHNNVVGSIVGTVGKVVGGIAHFFGF